MNLNVSFDIGVNFAWQRLPLADKPSTCAREIMTTETANKKQNLICCKPLRRVLQ